MKKFIIIIFVFVLILVMTACGKCNNSNNEKALFDLGIKVTKTMGEIVNSDEYISLYTSIEFEDEIVKFQATDYDSPISVYIVEMPSTKEILSKLGSENIDEYDKLSNNLKEQLDYKVSFSSLVSSINVQSGTNVMALCCISTADTSH